MLRRVLGLGAKRSQPPRVATDEVIPSFEMDDLAVARQVVISTTFRFDAVLEPETLRASLARLLETGNWRKLGGRMRLSVSTSRAGVM